MSKSASVSPVLEQFIQHEIASGRFTNRDAVISHALRLFMRERAEEEAVVGIVAGLADVAAGRLSPVGQTFAKLRTELGISNGS